MSEQELDWLREANHRSHLAARVATERALDYRRCSLSVPGAQAAADRAKELLYDPVQEAEIALEIEDLFGDGIHDQETAS
jgi:ATP phosphoribosyltransferase